MMEVGWVEEGAGLCEERGFVHTCLGFALELKIF